MNLYLRYLLPDWTWFKDMSRGTLFEQKAAHTHNYERRKWLVSYALRWLAIALLSNCVEYALLLIGWSFVSLLPGILSACSFAMFVLFMSLWARLEWSK